MTYDEIRDALEEISETFPGIGPMKLYYIGNCSARVEPGAPAFPSYPYNYDDRSWAIHLESWQVPDNRFHFAPHNVHLGTTEEMLALTPLSLGVRIGQQVVRATKAWREKYPGAPPPTTVRDRN